MVECSVGALWRADCHCGEVQVSDGVGLYWSGHWGLLPGGVGTLDKISSQTETYQDDYRPNPLSSLCLKGTDIIFLPSQYTYLWCGDMVDAMYCGGLKELPHYFHGVLTMSQTLLNKGGCNKLHTNTMTVINVHLQSVCITWLNVACPAWQNKL